MSKIKEVLSKYCSDPNKLIVNGKFTSSYINIEYDDLYSDYFIKVNGRYNKTNNIETNMIDIYYNLKIMSETENEVKIQCDMFLPSKLYIDEPPSKCLIYIRRNKDVCNISLYDNYKYLNKSKSYFSYIKSFFKKDTDYYELIFCALFKNN